jgi:hypothetical protein
MDASASGHLHLGRYWTVQARPSFGVCFESSALVSARNYLASMSVRRDFQEITSGVA